MLISVLSIRQPYAALIVTGLKSIECRTWKTNYRGLLYIHSSLKEREGKNLKIPQTSDFKRILKVKGAIIGTANLVECRKSKPSDQIKSHCPIEENYFSWILENPKVLDKPIPQKGKLGIFKINDL